MLAVIFTATLKASDDEYISLSKALRERAFSKYNCADFLAVNEGEKEVAISYWHSQDDLIAWKQDPLHRQAQEKGKALWYENYSVEVVEVVRRYNG